MSDPPGDTLARKTPFSIARLALQPATGATSPPLPAAFPVLPQLAGSCEFAVHHRPGVHRPRSHREYGRAAGSSPADHVSPILDGRCGHVGRATRRQPRYNPRRRSGRATAAPMRLARLGDDGGVSGHPPLSGGWGNDPTAIDSAVSGGGFNTAADGYGAVAGGCSNRAAAGRLSFNADCTNTDFGADFASVTGVTVTGPRHCARRSPAASRTLLAASKALSAAARTSSPAADSPRSWAL